MNQKRMKGFTLIELLAVIVILGIIAVIAVPVIMNIIAKANKSAFKDTAYGIINAGELYFAREQLEPNGMLENVTITLPDSTNTLELKGEVPEGSITITKEGKIAIAVHNTRYCVTKGIEEKDVTITEDIENCVIPVSITNITLKEGNIVLNKGEEKQIEVLFEPSEATNRTLNYVSDNTSVVTVDLNGKIKAVGKGTSKVIVTTTDGSNISKELNIEVQELASGIEVNTSSVSIINGGTYQLEATVVPETANNKGLNYTSLNESIARVSSTGLITGIAGGETKVVISTIDGSNITKEIDVIVRQQTTDITLDKTSVELEVGDTITVSATILPTNTYNKELKWESLDTSVATVSNGVITGVSNGTTKVKVTTLDGSNISKEIDVVVNTPIMTSDNACIQSGNICSDTDILAGIKVNVKVNNNQAYDFYVISNTDKEMTLIMDRNVGNKVAWYKDTDDSTNVENNNLGPITVLNYLNSETSDWTNIPVISNYKYDNNLSGEKIYGYQRLEITNGIGELTSQDGTVIKLEGISRARLLIESETDYMKALNNDTMPRWLYTNLSSSNTTEKPIGYWTLTATYSSGSSSARRLYYVGFRINAIGVYHEDQNGARPVITLTK